MEIIELTDGNITIKPLTLDDAEAHFNGEDHEAVKWQSGGVSTLEGVRKWIERTQEQWKQDGPVYNFGIFDQNRVLAGTVEANKVPEATDGIEIGDANISYVLYPQFRGQGLMRPAISLMEQFLTEKGFKRAVIRVDPHNVRSLEVPKRYGYEEIDVIKTKDDHEFVRFIKVLNET